MTMFYLGVPTLCRYNLCERMMHSALAGVVQPERIYVIDNGGKFSFQHPKVTIIRPNGNLGVSRSWNLLGKLARPADLVITNDDVVFGHDSLEKIVGADGDVVLGCGWASFLIREKAWLQVGEFDEGFFPGYCNDHDYQWRMKIAGMEPAAPLSGGCPIFHQGRASNAAVGGDKPITESYRMYRSKWGGMPGEEKFVIPYNSKPLEKPASGETIGVVMPVWMQNDAMLQQTIECVRRIESKHPVRLYIVTTRLHGMSPEELQTKLSGQVPVKVIHTEAVSLSVAAAWNLGFRNAIDAGCGMLMILANDVLLEPDTIDRLMEFGKADPTVDLWSGIDTRDKPGIDVDAVTNGADFSCVMLRQSALEKHGWFDERFRPAYFEDNDYYARVILGGGKIRQVHAAKFFHKGSMTIRLDADAKHHCDYWFEINRRRYHAKWGLTATANTPEEVAAKCFKHPWNDTSKPLTWWERD